MDGFAILQYHNPKKSRIAFARDCDFHPKAYAAIALFFTSNGRLLGILTPFPADKGRFRRTCSSK
jgi:hypothetical protein